MKGASQRILSQAYSYAPNPNRSSCLPPELPSAPNLVKDVPSMFSLLLSSLPTPEAGGAKAYAASE